MARAIITGVIISYIHGDESQTDYKVSFNGDYVSIREGEDMINLHRETWEEMRDQIDSMLGALHE
jgi:hypothetical protein